MPVGPTRKQLHQDDDHHSAGASSSNVNVVSPSGQHSAPQGNWIYPPPHLPQPRPSGLPIPANTSSSATSMIGSTSSFYDPEQALPPDTQDYQQWLDSSYPQHGAEQHQMGYLREGQDPSTTLSYQQHSAPRSTIAQQPPLQNQYQFVAGQYTPPSSSVTVNHHSADSQHASHFSSTSTTQNSQIFQSNSDPRQQGNEMYYYPLRMSSDALASTDRQSQSYQTRHPVANIGQQQHHAHSSTNPSPYTPASEVVNLPASAPHSSASPASWSEENSTRPGLNTVPQQSYRHFGSVKRDRNARKAPATAAAIKTKSNKRPRKSGFPPESGESESDDDYPAPATHSRTNAPTRLPGACTHCKKLKMKCDFPKNENTCKRCKAGGHQCIVEGRKPRTAPNKREYLLAQIRQKDAIIESLLKQLHNPYMATPLSISSYRMATSPSDQNNSNIIAWLDRLNSSVRSAGGNGAPKMLNLEPRPKTEQADSDDSGQHANGDKDEVEEAGADDTFDGGDSDDLRGLPDAAVPLGLIANLSLSNSKGRPKKKRSLDEEDLDDDNVGVANETYFMPGPATDLGIRATLIEQHSPPEILVHGLVAPEDVDKLFEIFFDRVNVFISLLDPVLHTPASTFARCPFLFTVICAISSRYYTEKSEIYPIAMHFAKHSAANALIDGWKSVELCQAYILMSVYAVPAKRWEEDRSWLYTGLAIRIATDLNLHQVSTIKPQNEKQEREILNRNRVWLICFNIDRSTATQFGKPSTIKEDYTVRNSKEWYKKSKYNHPFDIHTCGYTSLLRIVARFHVEIFSDPDSPTGLNKSVDFRRVTLTHDAHLSRYHEEWSKRFSEESDHDVPGAAFRCLLLPFLVAYSRLVMYSFGFQQAFQRGLQPGDDIFFTNCLDSAKSVIQNMVEKLAPSGYMRYAPDGHFVFAAFASAFLLKLLRPEFAHLLSTTHETEIFDLIGRLIQTLSSHEIAIDDRHTPKLYARFLAGLLIRHRRDGSGATTGRLHPLPPPQSVVHDDPSAQFTSPMSQGSTQSTFSVQPQGSSQGGQQHGGYSHTLFNTGVVPKVEPIYQSEGTFASGGAINFGSSVVDSGTFISEFGSPMSNGYLDEELLATMQTLKNPAWWSNMMMPGFSWPEPQPQMTFPNAESYIQQLNIPTIHNGFGGFHAPEVSLH